MNGRQDHGVVHLAVPRPQTLGLGHLERNVEPKLVVDQIGVHDAFATIALLPDIGTEKDRQAPFQHGYARLFQYVLVDVDICSRSSAPDVAQILDGEKPVEVVPRRADVFLQIGLSICLHADDVMEPESRSWIYKLRDTTSLHNDWRIVALIATFFGQVLVGSNPLLVLQYLSKRYELTIAKATLLMTIRSGVVLLLFLAILPYTTKAMLRHTSAQRKDIYLARASQALWATGWTLVGLSPSTPLAAASLAIAALGQGTTLLTRSFLASLLPPHHIARVYSAVSMVETIGSMLGSPALAETFTLGLSLGGMWIGLPFFFIGLVSAAFTVVMFAVRLRRNENEICC
jgi:hypothetical protein